jgi:uncharacterized protein (DUF2235 family)
MNSSNKPRNKLILCFDGTGNKFKGNTGDTNILKIFRMLDRSGGGCVGAGSGGGVQCNHLLFIYLFQTFKAK